MTTLPTEIPLFPLGTVLFPDGLLQLKVFEARYMDMVARCLKGGEPFGVCLIREGQEVGTPAEPHPLGTLATIVDWNMPEPGMLFISTRGGRCFRILERHIEPDRLQTAKVEWLPESPSFAVPPTMSDMLPLLRAVVADGGEDDFALPHRFDDAAWVGHRFAELLPISNEARYALLDLQDDPLSRLEIIHKYLKQNKLIGAAAAESKPS